MYVYKIERERGGGAVTDVRRGQGLSLGSILEIHPGIHFSLAIVENNEVGCGTNTIACKRM